MILLSNSIAKTGSTLLANYQDDILKKLDVRSGQSKVWTSYKGRYIDIPNKTRLLKLLIWNQLYGSFVIKCHWSNQKTLNLFCKLSNVKMTMTYRDPRDMILSMIDHGGRRRKGSDASGAFADCVSVVDVIPRTVKLMERLKEWQTKGHINFIRYEDLMTDPFKVLKNMILFLNWELSDHNLIEIINFRESTKMKSHNFNKGTTERWKKEMTQLEKDACLKAFKPYLEWLKYDLV